MRRTFFILILFSISSFIFTFANNSVRMIRKDRIWVYSGNANDVLPNALARHFYKFGTDVAYNGRIYTSFGLYKTEYLQKRYDSDKNIFYIDKTAVSPESTPIYFLREDEDGTIYILARPLNIKFSCPDNYYCSDYYLGDLNDPKFIEYFDTTRIDHKEFILYDFNSTNETFIPRNTSDLFLYPGYNKQTYSHSLNIEGDNCRLYQINYPDDEFNSSEISILFKDFYAIEGIGITKNGNLASWKWCFTAKDWQSNGKYPGEYSFLEGVYTLNYDPIFIFYNSILNEFNCKNEICFDTPMRISGTFDLLGNPISNPLPGSIYIRDGKKFVAK